MSTPEELFKNPKRLKNLMKGLDKADGLHDGIIHKSAAIQYINSLREKRVCSVFLDAATAFIAKGSELQRRLSNDEIDLLADIVNKPTAGQVPRPITAEAAEPLRRIEAIKQDIDYYGQSGADTNGK